MLKKKIVARESSGYPWWIPDVFPQSPVRSLDFSPPVDSPLKIWEVSIYIHTLCVRALIQYKRTGHWRKLKVMLSKLYFSAILKYYSQ